MNYRRIYDDFIASRRLRGAPDGYTESHHVLPVALGGVDEESNLIRLTAREHYFAHCCLAKIYGGKMWSALHAVAQMPKRGHFLRGRMVAVARERAAVRRSENMTKLWASGGFVRNRLYSPLPASVRAKISKSQMGKKMSAEAIAKQTASRRLTTATFSFFEVDSGVMFHGSQAEFCRFSGVDQSLASCLTRGRILWAKGWVLYGTDPASIKNRDPVRRRFVNRDGAQFVGTTYEFRTKFNLDSGVISNLIHGKNGVKSFKGWRCEGEA
jgi:hypothetical protein